MYTETICFYLIPALLGSVFTTEGGLIFVVLGIIMYLAYDNKKRLILSYMIFVVVYMFFMSTNIVPIILWKIKELIPIIGTGLSHGMEYLLSIIGGISPMDVGGNIFTIQYAALDMTGNENITYAYMLEGLDNTWKYVGGQRSVTYTNLKKGKYRLKIRSTNADGVWVENTRILPITILPSFWETGWAYFLYILSLCFFIAVFTYIFFVIYRLRNKVSMEQQIADIKLRFFTNISHELRTPLTLIIGPIEKILQKQLSQEIQDDLMLVKENTNRMLRLVNQLLDFRKVQNQKMKLKVSEVDLSVFIPFVMNNFKELSVRHHIDFCFETESEHLRIWIDQDLSLIHI